MFLHILCRNMKNYPYIPVCCDYLLEPSGQYGSNEDHNMFSFSNKKSFPRIILKTPPSLKLWITNSERRFIPHAMKNKFQ